MAARKKKKGAEPASRGLLPAQMAEASATAALQEKIASDGGTVLGSYREPLGGHGVVLAALPIEKVAPTPYQRDLSETHAARLAVRIEQVGRFLDPIIAVRNEDGAYWTPNGLHRLTALRQLGARAITALVLADREVAFQILALNTEKAHNLKERALEVIRMARALAELDPRPEKDYAPQFEEAALVTLGLCYEQRPRFSGSAYAPVLKRLDAFLPARLPKALEQRLERAELLLKLDEAVAAAVAALKERGFDSPYLRAFVVARINPLRFQKGAGGDFEEVIGRMTASALKFDAGKIKPDQVARAGGAPEE